MLKKKELTTLKRGASDRKIKEENPAYDKKALQRKSSRSKPLPRAKSDEAIKPLEEDIAELTLSIL